MSVATGTRTSALAEESPTMAENLDESALMKQKIHEMLDKETGMDRIKRMYSYNEYNSLSPELRYILRGGYVSAAVGGFVGAIGAMNNARENFLRSNEATAFDSEHLARRKLSDTMSLAGIKEMLKQGCKLGSFTTAYMLLTLTAANYNNKVTIWEHIGAGAFLGSVSRIKYGPKGVLVAGLLGSTLGLVGGSAIKLSMWLTGMSIQELRYWQHEYYNDEFMMKRKENRKENKRSSSL